MPRPPFIVAVADIPEVECHYPPPGEAEKLAFGKNLGKAVGSVRLGGWQERIPPGRRTSFTHAHLEEEEIVFVLSGTCHARLIRPGGEPEEHEMSAGDVASFPAGTGIAHCFVNNGVEDAVILCFGERRPDDHCWYPEDAAWQEHLRVTGAAHYWEGPSLAGQEIPVVRV